MSERGPKIIRVVFYCSESGKEPVRDWLMSISAQDRRVIGSDIKTIEFGWPLGMPVVKKIAGRERLWESRSTLQGGRIVRVLFTVLRGQMVLLHGFVKKTQKTPQQEIELGWQRKQRVCRQT